MFQQLIEFLRTDTGQFAIIGTAAVLIIFGITSMVLRRRSNAKNAKTEVPMQDLIYMGFDFSAGYMNIGWQTYQPVYDDAEANGFTVAPASPDKKLKAQSFRIYKDNKLVGILHVEALAKEWWVCANMLTDTTITYTKKDGVTLADYAANMAGHAASMQRQQLQEQVTKLRAALSEALSEAHALVTMHAGIAAEARVKAEKPESGELATELALRICHELQEARNQVFTVSNDMYDDILKTIQIEVAGSQAPEELREALYDIFVLSQKLAVSNMRNYPGYALDGSDIAVLKFIREN